MTSTKRYMRSGRARQLPEPHPVTFFLDRGLGRHYVADMLRKAGHVALPMADVYPNGRDQEIGDDEWIAYASAQGWVALTKDVAVVRGHAPALATSTLRVFALNNANVAGKEMAERYRVNLGRIVRCSQRVGPYLYVVGATGIERRWPKD